MGKILSDLGQSIIGNPKKAFLILHKSQNTIDEMDSAAIAAQTAQRLGGLGLDAAAAGLNQLTNAMGQDYHVMQVQYNPSSISIQANAMPIPTQYMQQNVDNGVPNQLLRPPQTVMSVELIFDAVNVKDAFMFEKFRLSVGDVVSDVAAGITGSKGGYTVQPQTNGLIGMIMRDSTRLVTFKWADMAFTGEVTEVQARYTMFSVSGKPIRSIVRFNITQQVESLADHKYWDDAFDKCFGTMDEAKETGGSGAAGLATNLLNIAF